MTDIRIWVDGTLVDPAQGAISAVDHGVTVGDGVFETAKIVDGEAFAVSRHLARMDRSLAGLGLPPVDHHLIRAGMKAVLATGPTIEFGRLRWTVTGGRGPLASDRGDGALTHIVTAASQAPPPRQGAVVVVPWVRNERAATAGLKTTSYADNVVALAYAKERGGTEALFANTRGELCEGTGSNVFCVIGGEVLTPPLRSGCLGGITRELVLEWATEDGIPVREVDLPMSALTDADEVFLTSSIKDVFAVTQVDGTDRGAPGPVTTHLQETFSARSRERIDP